MEEIEEINAGDQEHEPSTPAQAPRLTGLRDAVGKFRLRFFYEK